MSKPIDQEREALPELKSWSAFADALGLNFYMSDVLWQNALSLYEKITADRASVQPAGGAVPDIEKLREVWLFLVGLGELDGASFGDVPEGANRFWWRKHLRAAVEPILATAPHPVSGEQKPDALRKRFSDIEDEIMAGKHNAASVFTAMRTAALYIGQPAAQDVAGLVDAIDDACEWFELRGLHELNIYKALKKHCAALAAHCAQQGDAES